MQHLVALEVPLGQHDHIRGRADAPITLLEYGDFECPYCGAAYPVLRELEKRFGDSLRIAFRHSPRSHAHAHAERASEAAEAAGAQGKFWEMHDRLFENQSQLEDPDLVNRARAIGLDVARFEDDLRRHVYLQRVRDAEVSGAHVVLGTPTFFLNGLRFDEKPDLPTLSGAIQHVLEVRRGEAPPRSVVAETGRGDFQQNMQAGPHQFVADEPSEFGGTDTGPGPHELLEASLAACTSMTIQYAARKRGWQLGPIRVSVQAKKEGGVYVMRRTISFPADLPDERRAALLRSADRCPVSMTLTGPIEIKTEQG